MIRLFLALLLAATPRPLENRPSIPRNLRRRPVQTVKERRSPHPLANLFRSGHPRVPLGPVGPCYTRGYYPSSLRDSKTTTICRFGETSRHGYGRGSTLKFSS